MDLLKDSESLSPIDVSMVSRLVDVDPALWDCFMGQGEAPSPFISHGLLSLLESCGAVGDKSGWLPRHLLVHQQGELLAVMPLYQKSHSWGEYIFDWSWAEAYERCGLEYYPKLVSAVPFTPVEGVRLGMAPHLSAVMQQRVRSSVSQYLYQYAREKGMSSWHCLCHRENEWLENQGDYAARLTTQFHWHNDNGDGHLYADFDEFLARFRSAKRKAVRKERRAVANHNIIYRWRSAGDMAVQDWLPLIRCYQMTYLKRSGHAGYLPPSFFSGLSLACPDSALVLEALQDGDVIAAALYFKHGQQLYGRYWGALKFIPGLHFELCYYQGIEFAIANQLEVFNAGAQGEHKLARGFEPVSVYSTHGIVHDEFARAIAGFCQQERMMTLDYQAKLKLSLPFHSPSPD